MFLKTNISDKEITVYKWRKKERKVIQEKDQEGQERGREREKVGFGRVLVHLRKVVSSHRLLKLLPEMNMKERGELLRETSIHLPCQERRGTPKGEC